MTVDLSQIVQAKREYRRRLAARPIAEKLAMLNALRERQLAISGGKRRVPRKSTRTQVKSKVVSPGI